MAPAAVRLVDLGTPLTDLRLWQTRRWGPCRSLLAVACLDGEPLGAATFAVDSAGRVSADRLAEGIRDQLRPELREAFARRGLALPSSLPRSGVPGVMGTRRRGRATGRPVSVVVPTCCNPVALERCLRSIFQSDYGNFEVIVVENRPGAPTTRRMLSEQFGNEPHLRYVEQPRPGGSWARNTGLGLAEGDIVAFTDDDVVVDIAWIRECVDVLERADDVACVTGLILPLELEVESQLLLEQFAGFGKGFRRHTFRLPETREGNPLFPFTPGMMGSGANTVMRADVARELGGFDTMLGPGTPTTGGEDLDLYIQVLRAGYAVAYEPSAIVWHKHPEGRMRLRSQVYRYGVGLGAMLGKQLVAGPERMELLRAVPRGVRYAFDPSSRKNAGKPADYPRRLDWLERFGMLLGPVAYAVSALAASPGSSESAPTVERVVLSSGETVEVVSFESREKAARELAGRSTREVPTPAPRALVDAALTACVVAPLVVALGLPAALRLPAVLTLLCLAPGTAILTAARGRIEVGLVVGVSLGLATVVVQSMLWLGAWWPDAFVYGLAAVCLLPLASQVEARKRHRAERIPRLPSPRRNLNGIRGSMGTIAGAVAVHGTLLSSALVAWTASLLVADPGRIDGLGLLNALPPAYFLAVALLLLGFARAVTGDKPRPELLGLYVLGLIVVLHGTTPLLYDEPRYAWVYKHLGAIDLIAATGGVDRQIDVYNNWPAFLAANASFSTAVGLAPIAYAAWAQVFFNLFNVAAVRFALRGLTDDERLLWTAALLFVLGNWVGQDYLAPQAFGFALSLVVLGLCLRCGQGAGDQRPVLGPRAAVIVGGVCFLAVVMSHQLSPVVLILGVAALSVIARRVPLWIPVAMALIEAWWVKLAWPFVGAQFSLIQPGATGAGAPGRNLDAGLPGARLSLYGAAAVSALMVLLALIGMVRRYREGRRDLVPVCLILAPALVAGLQSYGGEGGYRAYLFALPWLAFFAAVACMRRPSKSGSRRMGFGRVSVAASAVCVCLLFAYFGQELANRIPSDDVRAAAWYEQHAPSGSVRVNLAPITPDRLTPRYPDVSLDNPAALLERPGFAGHRLGARDVPRLERLGRELSPHPTFVALSRAQEEYGRLNGLLPQGSVSGLARAMGGSDAFRLVYRRPTAWIFEYIPPAER